MTQKVFTANDIESAAKAAHEVNRVFCTQLGDWSHKSWEDSEEWQRESSRAGVCGVIENPDMTPEASHRAWMDHKLEEGWVLGEVKDAEKKTHPCLKPYEELEPQQRAKDYIFIATVRGILGIA